VAFFQELKNGTTNGKSTSLEKKRSDNFIQELEEKIK
jgi:hypothetical protein